MVLIIFVAAFGTSAISFWPYMMPGVITINEAAAPHSSLTFMFWGERPLRLTFDVGVHAHQLQSLQRIK
jgi:cytochrome bd-type quinol oxidase subunit 2